ncbi:Transposase [Cribrihabitans marinus]|uniref:Transposase n=1 Tax=Cribrihabitans marinus TaxID=1227549 RepID=A0A1H7CLK4_9RHOB|nr:IS1595 family transposase [Cribrihabitans marinus]GGH35881.1 DDE transposase [Cribrihabitans marinus]SEJ90346.1 Transposase [Cribrihabitans marinus]
MSILSRKEFHNEEAAYEYVEARVWPHGATCPKCGETERVSKMGGKSTRIGAYKCYKCRKPFTVKVGTIFESSHVKMHVWLQAIYLMCASKKGISSNQLHRILGVTLKTAWFMSHRIREAMRSGDLAPMGGGGGVVEVDETFIGNDRTKKPHGVKKGRGYAHKHKVLGLVDRATGRAKSFVVDDVKAKTLVPILRENIAKEASVMTDEASQYFNLSNDFASHDFVRHQQGEYGRGEIPTNTIEGFYSIFKRGMKGVYQHCSKEHLHRYMAEFDFRYSNRVAKEVDDKLRADIALLGIVGKRLTYETIGK